MKNTITAILIAGFLGSGCSNILNPAGSSKFDCPGMPNGVVCKTPREVYNLTNGDNSSVSETTLKQTLPNDRVVNPKEVVTSKSNGPAYAASEAGMQPEPLVTQTQVLRIWIAPWVDKRNDLHWPGLMFTKIQKSEWNYGQNSFENVQPPVPHLISPSIVSQGAQDTQDTQEMFQQR